MAQKIQTLFIDDLDGSEADGTVRFGLDGTDYEIDLNAKHAQELRDALARYVMPPGGPEAPPGAQPATDTEHKRTGRTAPKSGSGPRHKASTSKTADECLPNWSSSSRLRPVSRVRSGTSRLVKDNNLRTLMPK